MNWQDIIYSSDLVYASAPDDEMFRTWSLKKTTCKVSFYEIYPTEDLDKIICGILYSNNGSLEENKIATILGFNVIDDFEVTPKRYVDKAELDIFRAIIEPVYDWGLISKSKENIIILTELGYRTLQTEEKYRFYLGQKILFENFGIKSQNNNDNLFFPYYSSLGLFSKITDGKQIDYKEINLIEVFEIEESDLIKRHRLQSKESYQIYKSETTNYFEISSCDVDIRLYKLNDEYFPIIFYNNQISVEATKLLYKPENTDLRLKKIEWGLYLKLMRDPDAVLDYNTIIPFEDLLELNSLVRDTRLAWQDKNLFTFIAQRANANQWHTMSNQCPIEVIKIHIDKYVEKWDWTSFSLRIDDNFLIENAIKYPWNFEVISTREDISIDLIKILLLNPELKEQEWDWKSIMPQLDFDFIKTNIDKIDFELSELTKTNTDEIQFLITQYPEKRWNWSYISTEYDLSFILDNILNFRQFLQLKNVINRAFISENDVKLFSLSCDFVKVLSEEKDSTLKGFQPNQADYKWSEQLIDLLERTGYLIWKSRTYILGFECNPHVEWTYDYFKKYHSKITTPKGFSFVSQMITDPKIVFDYLNFNWDWDKVSTNKNLIEDQNFVLNFADKINLSLLLEYAVYDIVEILFEQANLLYFLENNPDGWQTVTKKSSIEFVLRHVDYNWDWKYLTKKLDLSFILDNLAEYYDYWDWNWLLSEQFQKKDLLLSSHLLEVAINISKLNNQVQENLWEIITRKFDYEELEQLIVQTYSNKYIDLLKWDYAYFYDLEDFNIRNYLQNFPVYICWEELSRSNKLNEELKWEKQLFNYNVWINDVRRLLFNNSYKWNFKSLSKLDSINWNDSIFGIYTDKWDWNYLSEYSTYFNNGENFANRFQKFSKYIVYSVFSRRTNTGLTEEILSEHIDKDWDWGALSTNNGVTISFNFIKQHKNKQWDWGALSSRNDIVFDNRTLIKLSNENWDWEEISKRTDIGYSDDLIDVLKDKPLNWGIISQNQSFTPNSKTLSLLKAEELDWSAISKNENISEEIFWDYRESLNWEYLTKNKQFDISDIELLSKYRDFVDWKFVSEKFDVSSIGNLNRFKDKLHWTIVNQKLSISVELLEPFADVLDWSKVSKSMEIYFTEELIERYRNYWDWQLLRNNSQIIERLETSLKKYQLEFNCVDFIERFDRQPYIYHFTHLFNAVDIIRSRKILSRHKAEGKFANAAGNLVARRDTAHNFARFYFRPQTPTQFYNECLGMDFGSGDWGWQFGGYDYSGKKIWNRVWKSYYPQAKKLSLPKCPMPVFLKFSLKEVLMNMADKCYYSTGNMQTNWARVEKVSENPNELHTEYLYSDFSDYNNYKQYSQQEFLVSEEFDFSKLDSFEIICYDEEQENILKSQLGNDPICKKIHANGWDVFHRDNRKLNIEETETEISIYSEYSDSAYFSIKGIGLQSIQILNPDDIQKETATEIIAYPEIRFTKTEEPIEVHFVDLAIGKREWLIYKN